MKNYTYSFLFLAFLVCCNKKTKQPVNASEQKDKTSVSTNASTPIVVDHISLRKSVDALVLDRDQFGKVAKENLEKLKLLSPSMLEADIFSDVIGAVSDEQLIYFKGQIFDAVKHYAPKAGHPLSPKYGDVVRLAQRLHTTELPSLVFDHLRLAPPYEFPAAPLQEGWGGPDLIKHYSRGIQGLVCSIIVEDGDSNLIDRYRSELKQAEPKLQRVMVWALGKSPNMVDFETLVNLYEKNNEPGMRDTIKRAMNAIPRSMERTANHPVSGQAARSNLSSSDYLRDAKKCRDFLKSASLTMELSIWD